MAFNMPQSSSLLCRSFSVAEREDTKGRVILGPHLLAALWLQEKIFILCACSQQDSGSTIQSS